MLNQFLIDMKKEIISVYFIIVEAKVVQTERTAK